MLFRSEFNEMNIASRVFLKDFFALLNGFDPFRLNKTMLMPLSPYESRNEIFRFQNLIAVRRDISPYLVRR